MNPATTLRLVGPTLGDGDLERLLRRAAAGDERAFMAFYDATCRAVFTLEVARARGLDRAGMRVEAEDRTRQRFVQAWRCCAQQAGSGLSPLAWLLSLHGAAPAGPHESGPAEDEEASCA